MAEVGQLRLLIRGRKPQQFPRDGYPWLLGGVDTELGGPLDVTTANMLKPSKRAEPPIPWAPRQEFSPHPPEYASSRQRVQASLYNFGNQLSQAMNLLRRRLLTEFIVIQDSRNGVSR